MRMAVALVALRLAAPAGAVTNGDRATGIYAPFGMFGYVDAAVGDLLVPVCSGTLVDANHVLTSATCVEAMRAARQSGVSVDGQVHWHQNGEPTALRGIVADVDAAAIHPEYDGSSPDTDLAIITLAEPSDKAASCITDLRPELAELSVRLIGHGENGSRDRRGGIRRTTLARWTTPADPPAVWETTSGQRMGMACAKDTGGAVVVQTTDDTQMAVLAVISRGAEACDPLTDFGKTLLAKVPNATSFIVNHAPGVEICRDVDWDGYGRWVGPAEPPIEEPEVPAGADSKGVPDGYLFPNDYMFEIDSLTGLRKQQAVDGRRNACLGNKVFVGEVAAIEPFRFDGMESGQIWSRVTLDVHYPIRGEVNSTEDIYIRGGDVDGERQLHSAEPRARVGDTLFLSLSPPGPDDTTLAALGAPWIRKSQVLDHSGIMPQERALRDYFGRYCAPVWVK